jgi:hypothetical protein
VETNVRQFRQVRYHNVYPGVDLVLYGNHRQLEFDFDLASGADASSIRLNFYGATVQQHGQDLELVTPSGNIAVLKKPELYQGEGRTRKTIYGGYVVRKSDQVAFSIGRYDKRQPLVIDPALIYSTFVQINSQTGGADVPFAIALDSSGAAYVTGLTNIGGPNGGSSAFVIKINAAGSALVYEAHLAGASAAPFNEFYQLVAGEQIAVDVSGNAYVVGTTQQGDFPTTRGTFSTTAYCGAGVGCLQPFATKLDANGAIVYSTFLVQASALDSAGPAPSSIAVDSNGALYVTGTTTHQFPTGNAGPPPAITVPGLSTTPGAFQATRKNDSSGFVLKLHPDGSKLDYSTYLGGSTGETPGGIAVDSSGVAYVDGGTSSSDFPTTQGAFQTANSSTNTFFTKLKSDGSGLLYSTFLSGPNGQSMGTSIAIDSSKSSYLAGMTATTIPTPMFATHLLPAFAAKFDASGNLAYSTLLPHPITFGIDSFYATTPPSSIAVDNAGAAYVATAFDYVSDIAVNKLDSAGSVVYSIGAGSVSGNNIRFGGMALDSHQNFYVAGTAEDALDPASPGDTIPGIVTTPGAFQMFPLGPFSIRMYVQKFRQSLGSAVPIPNPSQINFSAILQKGTASVPRTVQLYNYGDAALTISSIGIGGANASDFSISTSNKACGATLPAQSGCSFLVVFTPTVDTGTRNATVELNFGGLPSQSLPLTGKSGFPIFQASSRPLDLGNVVVGVSGSLPSFSEATLTITNTGTGPLNFPSSPAIVGPNAGEFCTGSPPAAGHGCSPFGAPFSIPPGATGGVRVVFIPNVPGPATAQLIVVSNDTGSPHIVQIMGNAIAPGNGTFSIAPANGSSTSSTITAGQLATYNLIVAAANNFGGGTIAVSCSGAPTGASCNVSPSSFSLRSGASQNLTVSVKTMGRTSASLNRTHPGLWWSLATMIGMVVVRPRRRRFRGMLMIIGILTLCGAMISCTGGSGGGGQTGTPAGRYALTVNASANGSINSTNLTLIVK